MTIIRLILHIGFAVALLGAAVEVTFTMPQFILGGVLMLALAAATVGYAIASLQRDDGSARL